MTSLQTGIQDAGVVFCGAGFRDELRDELLVCAALPEGHKPVRAVRQTSQLETSSAFQEACNRCV